MDDIKKIKLELNKKIADLEKRNEFITEVINDTHQKIELGDKYLYDKLDKQEKIINALISILVNHKILKDENHLEDVIKSQDLMEKLTMKDLTEEETFAILQKEANDMMKYLYLRGFLKED